MAGLRVVGAGDAINWYKGAWDIFKSNIANWVLMALILFVIGAVLMFIPFVGAIAFYVLFPIFLAGMFYSAQKLDQGQEADIMDIFIMFKDQQRLTPLIILGLLFLVVGFLSAMVIGGMMFASVSSITPGAEMPMMPTLGLGSFFMVLIVAILSFMLFMFSIPLVVFQNMSAIDAIKNSFMACVKNFPAFIVFMAIYFLLAIVAVIPFGLGVLVLVPIMIAATYVGYKRIFA